MPRHRLGRARAALVWTATALLAFGIGAAGLAKFLVAARWQALFVGWGYPPWFSTLVGVAEVAGAVALLVPRFAFYAALGLGVIMLGAVGTLLIHRGGPLGWGATPLVYTIMLAGVAIARMRPRVAVAGEVS